MTVALWLYCRAEVDEPAPMLADTGIWLPIIAIGVMMYFGGKAYASFAKKTWDWSVADAVITRVSDVNFHHKYSTGATRGENPLKV